MKTNEIKNLEEIEMKILLLKKKKEFERMRNSLDGFEMNESEENVNAEIKILINNKDKVRKLIKDIK